MNKSMLAIMLRISQIVAHETDAINFTIVGWGYLKTRLILHFDDCDQVCEFRWEKDGEFKELPRFFTADRPFKSHEVKFHNLYHEAKPETKLLND